jgi:hypothetical protein
MNHAESSESSEKQKQFLLTPMTLREAFSLIDPKPTSAIWYHMEKTERTEKRIVVAPCDLSHWLTAGPKKGCRITGG